MQSCVQPLPRGLRAGRRSTPADFQLSLAAISTRQEYPDESPTRRIDRQNKLGLHERGRSRPHCRRSGPGLRRPAGFSRRQPGHQLRRQLPDPARRMGGGRQPAGNRAVSGRQLRPAVPANRRLLRPRSELCAQAQATGESRSAESAEPHSGATQQPVAGDQGLCAAGLQRTAG